MSLRLSDVVIPDPFASSSDQNTTLLHQIPTFKENVRRVLKKGVELGVMNDRDSDNADRQLRNLTNSLLDVLTRIQRVNHLDEGFTREEYYDLRYRWKDGFKLFLKFRDTLREIKNTLLQGHLISRNVGDDILAQTEEYCRMLDELDLLIQKTIKELFQF